MSATLLIIKPTIPFTLKIRDQDSRPLLLSSDSPDSHLINLTLQKHTYWMLTAISKILQK